MLRVTYSVLEARLVSSCLSWPSRAKPHLSLLFARSGVTMYILLCVNPGPIGQPSLFLHVFIHCETPFQFHSRLRIGTPRRIQIVTTTTQQRKPNQKRNKQNTLVTTIKTLMISWGTFELGIHLTVKKIRIRGVGESGIVLGQMQDDPIRYEGNYVDVCEVKENVQTPLNKNLSKSYTLKYPLPKKQNTTTRSCI